MGCDVFISYAHDDNDDGFITKLTEEMEKMVKTRLGRRITVWTDKKIPPGDDWEVLVLQKLWTSRLMVPVVSPSWLNSQWCGREWSEKWRGLRNDFYNSSRTSILPVAFQLNESARKQDAAQLRMLQFSKGSFDDLMDLAQLRKNLAPLCDALSDSLKILDNQEKPLPNPRGKVFLGMAFTIEMLGWRTEVKRNLRGTGFDTCQVDWKDDWDPAYIQPDCAAAMEGCVAAVHFLDSHAGPGRGTSRPFPLEFQLMASAQKARQNPEFQEFKWAGSYDRLLRTARPPDYWEQFLQPLVDSTEDSTLGVNNFTTSVLLAALNQAPPPAVPPADEEYLKLGIPVACVVYENKDKDVVTKAVEYLRRKGWQVDLAAVYDDVQKYFPRRNTFVFYWGKADDEWCKGNLLDLNETREDNDVPAPSAIAVYIGEEYYPLKVSNLPDSVLSPIKSWNYFVEPNPPCKDFDPDNIPPRFKEFIKFVEKGAQRAAAAASGSRSQPLPGSY